jgi:hypothetical protein
VQVLLPTPSKWVLRLLLLLLQHRQALTPSRLAACDCKYPHIAITHARALSTQATCSGDSSYKAAAAATYPMLAAKNKNQPIICHLAPEQYGCNEQFF